MRKPFLLIEFVMAAIAAAGQPAGSRPLQGSETVAVHGEISSDESDLTSLTVELKSAGRGLPEKVDVNPYGSFDIPSLTPGAYQLLVSSPGGMTLYEEHVNLRNPRENLLIRLPSTAKAKADAKGTVSIQQLQHNTPGSARKALKKAQEALQHGRVQEALHEFQRAISIDPEFADAYNDLGALYAATGEPRKAVEQFRKAVDIDHNHARALSNLCLTLGQLGELDEARRIARQALQIDPANAKVHYVLAISLMNTPGGSVEALDHLQRAGSEVPMAHLVAAQLLTDSGRRDEARRHLKEYLAGASSEAVLSPLVDALRRQLQE